MLASVHDAKPEDKEEALKGLSMYFYLRVAISVHVM